MKGPPQHDMQNGNASIPPPHSNNYPKYKVLMINQFRNHMSLTHTSSTVEWMHYSCWQRHVNCSDLTDIRIFFPLKWTDFQHFLLEFSNVYYQAWKRSHVSPACAVCCLLVIICFPFLIKGRKNCCKSGHCVTLAISQTRLWWVYVWSGLGSGKRLDWLSCIGAKCNTAQNYLSTPTHVNLAPPSPRPVWYFSLHTRFVIHFFPLL